MSSGYITLQMIKLDIIFTLRKPLNIIYIYIYQSAILIRFFVRLCSRAVIRTVESLKKGQTSQRHAIIIVINNNIILFAKNKQMSCRHLCPRSALGLILLPEHRTSVCFLVLPAVDNEVFELSLYNMYISS